MKSTSGTYFVGLDHLRALAALLVFTWHFIHGHSTGSPIPYEYLPDPVIGAFFTEGHWGVSLFMTLSGYLFARLLDGRQMDYGRFLWNRVLRLAPLLFAVFAFNGVMTVLVRGGSILAYAKHLASGLVLPTWDSGAWSITVEMHFYLVLPALLLFSKTRAYFLPAVVLCAIAFRTAYWAIHGQVGYVAYWSIIGRIDDFAMGIIAFRYREWIKGRHGLMAAAFAIFLAGYSIFIRMGGFDGTQASPIWIILPTLEATFCAILVAWYEQSFAFTSKGMSGWIARIGTYSYSIYLLHMFVVFRLPPLIGQYVDLSNFYVALFASFLCFLAMIPFGAISYHGFEAHFLKLRRKYIVDGPAQSLDTPTVGHQEGELAVLRPLGLQQ